MFVSISYARSSTRCDEQIPSTVHAFPLRTQSPSASFSPNLGAPDASAREQAQEEVLWGRKARSTAECLVPGPPPSSRRKAEYRASNGQRRKDGLARGEGSGGQSVLRLSSRGQRLVMVLSSNSDSPALNDDVAVVCVEYCVMLVCHERHTKPRHFDLPIDALDRTSNLPRGPAECKLASIADFRTGRRLRWKWGKDRNARCQGWCCSCATERGGLSTVGIRSVLGDLAMVLRTGEGEAEDEG
ncbi:hypothetical protein V8D89_000280 [Ganoderma adspersum]